MYLMQAVPNERELDVSYVRTRNLGLDLERLHPWCPRILKLTWKGANEKGKRNQHFMGIGGALAVFHCGFKAPEDLVGAEGRRGTY